MVAVNAVVDGAYVVVTVADNGIGIPAALLHRVYEPFFSTKARGTGLGLTVCKQIVALHSGEISIQSPEGKGTSVVVRLPI